MIPTPSLSSLEPDDLATLRIRTIRRDGYRCQVLRASGLPCLEPGTKLAVIPRGIVTACKAHENHG